MTQSQQDQENFEYINNTYSKHLNCGLCLKMFNKPIRLHPCAHSFCQKCVNHDYVIFCPTCDSDIQLKQFDLTAANLITDLKVKCKNDGCPWKGQLEQYTKFHRKDCKLKSGGIQAWLQKINKSILATQSKIKVAKSLEQQQIDQDECVQIQAMSSSSKKIKRQPVEKQCQKINYRQGEQIRADKRRLLYNDQEIKDKNKITTPRIEIKIPKYPNMKQSLVYPPSVNNIYKFNSLSDKNAKIISPSKETLAKNFEQKTKKSTIGEIIVPDMNKIASLTDKYLAPSEENYVDDQIFEWQISDQYQQQDINSQGQSDNKKIEVNMGSRCKKQQQKPKQKPIEISSSIFRPFDFLVNKHISNQEPKKQNYSNKRLYSQNRR